MRGVLLALLAGCLPAEEVPDGTWLRDLQIIGVEVDPPDLRPGGSSRITITAVDPKGRGADVLVWACTPAGEGCYEMHDVDGTARDLAVWTRAGLLRDDRFDLAFDAPDLPLSALFEDDQALLLWSLACAPGACEAVERIRANPAPGTQAWHQAVALLASPDAWLGELSPGVASLAVKAVRVRAAVDNQNPTVTGPERVEVGPGEPGAVLELRIHDDDPSALRVRAFSTFGPVEVRGDGREAQLGWRAPGWVGQGRIYGVISDGEGGLRVWRGEVSVRP